PRPGSSAIAGPRPRRLPAIEGAVPDLARLPPGCAFHPRCPDAMPECREVVPPLLPLGGAAAAAPAGAENAGAGAKGPDGAHRVACFLHHDTAGRPRLRPAAEQAS
ncbi:MAG TPA: oligopeptide/dipeptide ABC transporter ATP-binding protein, partial [Candidatus Polarisedimenticolia bacterium]|nr:oligopeptide/dipeptide ABC transporter ATP-binding protein [Candidatus Polarisedimenticolia bacterium]